MLVNVNMSFDVYNYFKNYDLSRVADTLLEMYDFTNLPQIVGKREKEIKVNVSNEAFLHLYNTLGPRSKKVSLGRLFEYAYSMEVLSLQRFQTMRLETHDDPTYSLVDRAYKTLLMAQKYNNSEPLQEITQLVYNYREALKSKKEKGE